MLCKALAVRETSPRADEAAGTHHARSNELQRWIESYDGDLLIFTRERSASVTHEVRIARKARFARSPAVSVEAQATGVQASGAHTIGTLAVGAVAVGALAIGRLVIGRARV